MIPGSKPVRILLLGKYGQLGWELQRTLFTLGDLICLDFPEIDLTQEDQIISTLRQVEPQVIVNATAYTAVDQAEHEPEIARAVNTVAPSILAEEASALGAALIHYSTDYVFDGKKNEPYLETDRPNPLGVYGQSKLEGENAIREIDGAYLILRTSWVYSLRRDSFVTKVLQWSRQQETLRVVADQVSGPTWARMLAEVTAQLLAAAGSAPSDWIRERRGLYHLAGSGHTSRYEWAHTILSLDPRREEQVAKKILPAQTVEFPTPAQRPLYSALNCDLFSSSFNLRLPEWETALALALAGDI
jgi:dTDP-4-dehydrorhamnose reductase